MSPTKVSTALKRVLFLPLQSIVCCRTELLVIVRATETRLARLVGAALIVSLRVPSSVSVLLPVMPMRRLKVVGLRRTV